LVDSSHPDQAEMMQGRQVIAEKSGHCIQDDEPAVVAKAIHEIIAIGKTR
jgi:pimeloyl-ACP methyl ester carboxylesterase